MNKDELKEIIRQGDISEYFMHPGMIICRNREYFDKHEELIRQLKPEILEYLHEQEAAEKAEREDKERRIAEIEGLKEITDAKYAISEWYEKFNRTFEGPYACGGLGCGPKPEYDFEEAYKKYPRAAAYLKCEEYATKFNYELSKIGKEALNEVIYGDYQKALEMLEAGRSEFAMRHAWD